MNYIKNLISLFLFTLSFNSFANIDTGELNVINKFLLSYGYESDQIEFNSDYINNSYKISLKSINKEINTLRPLSTLFILNNKKDQGFIVFDIQNNNPQKYTFDKFKTSITYFQKNNRQFLKFSLPIQVSINSEFNNVDIYNSTTHSFLLPKYSNTVLFGEIISFKGDSYTNITKKLIISKKETEEKTIKDIILQYPDLLLNYKNVKSNNTIVILFSESCSYCRKMIKNYKKYNDKGYNLLVLPAPEISYDLNFNQSTYQFFCSDNISKGLISFTRNESCDPKNEKTSNIYSLKRDLLQGIYFRGTPTLYLTEYNLWFSGYLDHKSF